MAPRCGKRHPFLAIAAVLCALASFADRPLSAQPMQNDALVVPLHMANGHVVIVGDLVGLRFTNEVSLEVSFEYPDALTLHPDQYGWLGLDPNDLGLADPPQVHFLLGQGKRISIPANEVAVEQSAERIQFQLMMTKMYSAALVEHKLKGTIGIGLLKKYHVTLDLPAKQMTLAPPHATSDATMPSASASADAAGAIVRPFEYTGNRIMIGLSYGESGSGRLAIGGSEYDSLIDSRVAGPIGKPAGDVSPVWLVDAASGDRKLDLSRYVAFRPQAFGLSATPSADSPAVIAGWNLLENFRIELDWANQSVSFTQRKMPHYPQSDFEFFKAESAGSSNAMQAYLEKYPHERLSAEAASDLVKWRIEKDKAPDADVMKALTWAVDASLPDRRIDTCMDYLTMFSDLPGRTDLAIAAGLEGLKHSREAFDARVVYKTHNALGELYMKKNAWNDAWKHFLSAAFMAPDDLGIALNLARVYDHQGQTRRAYARYKRVAEAPGAPPEIAAEIKAAMDRLKKLLPKDDPLLKDDKTGPGRGRGGVPDQGQLTMEGHGGPWR